MELAEKRAERIEARKYKTKYRVSNWSDYDLALVQRSHER